MSSFCKKYIIGFAGTSAFACPFFEELQKIFEIRFLMTKAIDPKSKLYSFAKFIKDKNLEEKNIYKQNEVEDKELRNYDSKKKQDNDLEGNHAGVIDMKSCFETREEDKQLYELSSQEKWQNRELGSYERRSFPCYYPAKMKEIDEFIFEGLDAMIVIAYGHKIPKRMLDKCVWINLHGSILPKFRGAAPINYSIMAGEEQSGLSATIMAEQIDAGPVIETMSVPIESDDNSADLALRMQKMGREWFAQTVLGYLEGRLSAIPQDPLLATFAPSITAESRKLDWGKSAFEIHNKIRALSPNMCCSLDLEETKLKLVASRLLSEDYIPPEIPQIGKPISFEKTDKLIIRCGEGFLRLTQIVPDSSKQMSDEEFVRGYRNLLKS